MFTQAFADGSWSRGTRVSAPVGGVVAAALLGAVLATPGPVRADGTEGLGPPTVPVAPGTGVAVGGTGLFEQPGTIEVTVPEDATVEQALLYWEGQHLGSEGDDTLVLAGTEVTGTRIGGPRLFFHRVSSSTYRADVTDLGLVTSGTTSLTVEGADFGVTPGGAVRNDGAGLLVIYDQGGPAADVAVRDGNDLAFAGFDPPLDATVPQTYEFAPAEVPRTATLALFASSVAADRPAAVDVTVDGETQRRCDVLVDGDGPQWDSVALPVVVPAGAGEVTVAVRSVACPGSGRSGKPASVAWSAAALVVPPPDRVAGLELSKTNDADRDGTFTDTEAAPRPGAEVAFEVVVANTGATALAVDALTDSLPGAEVDLLAGIVTGSGAGPLTSNTCEGIDNALLPVDESRTCRFALDDYAPPEGESLVDTVEAVVHDPADPTASITASDTSTVTSPAGAVLAGQAAIVLDKTNDADGDGAFSDVETAPAAGADVAFEVVVRNVGSETLVLDALTDSFDGGEVDLLAPGGDARLIANSCGALAGARVPADGSRTCRFTLGDHAPPPGGTVVNTGQVVGHPQQQPDRSVVDRDDSTVRSPEGGHLPRDVTRLPRTGDPLDRLGALAALLLVWGGGLLWRTRYRPRH